MTDPSTTTSTHCSGVALVASLRRTHQIFIPSTYHALFRHIKSNAQLYDYRHLHHHHLVTCTPKKGSAIPPQKSLFFFSGRDPIPGLATAPDDLHHITSHTHLAMVIIYNLQSRPHVFFLRTLRRVPNGTHPTERTHTTLGIPNRSQQALVLVRAQHLAARTQSLPGESGTKTITINYENNMQQRTVSARVSPIHATVRESIESASERTREGKNSPSTRSDRCFMLFTQSAWCVDGQRESGRSSPDDYPPPRVKGG